MGRRRTEPADVASVELDAEQAEWLRAHGGDPAATLLRLLKAEMRRETLKRAVAEERHVELLIRRHAKKLKTRLPAPRTEADFRRAAELEERAARELLPAFDNSADPLMRHAALRFRFRHGIEPDGTHTGRRGDRAQLQRLREQRPGGWR